MSEKVTEIKISARTDVGRERDHNEDNFIVNPNLEQQNWSFDNRETIKLGKYGSLLAVADGMGGTNAGEVASKIAIESLKDFYHLKLKKSPKITDEFLKETLKESILNAHNHIADHQKKNKATEGMGTTLILGWIINNKLYCSWSGDSRCYLYKSNLSEDNAHITKLNKKFPQITGNFILVSKDHSFVQELIDNENLTYEQAFYHPQSNIITQSLGDETRKPNPDYISLDLEPGDRVILCSDGLNGMLQDQEINEIITDQSEINKCTQELIDSSNKAGGSDNITIVMADIISVNTDDLKKTDEKSKKIATSAFLIVLLLASSYISIKIFLDNRCEVLVAKEAFLVRSKNGDSFSIKKGDSTSVKPNNLYSLKCIVQNDSVSLSKNHSIVIFRKRDSLYINPKSHNRQQSSVADTGKTNTGNVDKNGANFLPLSKNTNGYKKKIEQLNGILTTLSGIYDTLTVGLTHNNDFKSKLTELNELCESLKNKSPILDSDFINVCKKIKELQDSKNDIEILGVESDLNKLFRDLTEYDNEKCGSE